MLPSPSANTFSDEYIEGVLSGRIPTTKAQRESLQFMMVGEVYQRMRELEGRMLNVEGKSIVIQAQKHPRATTVALFVAASLVIIMLIPETRIPVLVALFRALGVTAQ